MSGFIQEFQFYMSYPFVRYALIVGVLISLCSSLLGVTLVLKRFSFIGDGLSHVAFGALAIATVLKIANVNIFIMPVTIVCAILLLRTGTNTKLKGDAAIAMLSVGSMAVGYLILNVFSVSSNVSGDVCSTLFGSTSILTLTGSEVIFPVIRIDPLKTRRIRIRSVECRIFAIHLQQCLHKILQIPMLLFPKKEPVKFSLLAPLSKLTEFLPHK